MDPLGTSGGMRADLYVAEVLKLFSRSQFKARGALLRVNGKVAKPSTLLKGGERLEVEWTEEASPELVPEELPLSIVYEDERVIVVDKAQGMVTHPGHGNRRGTFANALLGRMSAGATSAAASEPAGGNPDAARHVPPSAAPLLRAPLLRAPLLRAGIVHRLDKDTSGVLIAAKDAEAQAYLASQFKDRLTKKEYLAIIRGIPRPLAGQIEDRLARDPRNRKRFAALPAGKAEGGKPAFTDYRVIATYGDYALVSLRPRTGRTHQLRVHMAGLGTPIVGDPIYGKPDRNLEGATLMLHAFRLRIRLPGAEEPSVFKAPLPERFRRLLAFLEKRYGKTIC